LTPKIEQVDNKDRVAISNPSRSLSSPKKRQESPSSAFAGKVGCRFTGPGSYLRRAWETERDKTNKPLPQRPGGSSSARKQGKIERRSRARSSQARVSLTPRFGIGGIYRQQPASHSLGPPHSRVRARSSGPSFSRSKRATSFAKREIFKNDSWTPVPSCFSDTKGGSLAFAGKPGQRFKDKSTSRSKHSSVA
jgi:hypothetical protein